MWTSCPTFLGFCLTSLPYEDLMPWLLGLLSTKAKKATNKLADCFLCLMSTSCPTSCPAFLGSCWLLGQEVYTRQRRHSRRQDKVKKAPKKLTEAQRRNKEGTPLSVYFLSSPFGLLLTFWLPSLPNADFLVCILKMAPENSWPAFLGFC